MVRSRCTGISIACGDPGGVAMRTPSSASPARVTSKRMLPTMALKLPVRCPSFSARPLIDSPSDPNAGSAPCAVSFPLLVSTPSTTSTGRAPVVEPIHSPSKALALAADGAAWSSECEACTAGSPRTNVAVTQTAVSRKINVCCMAMPSSAADAAED